MINITFLNIRDTTTVNRGDKNNVPLSYIFLFLKPFYYFFCSILFYSANNSRQITELTKTPLQWLLSASERIQTQYTCHSMIKAQQCSVVAVRLKTIFQNIYTGKMNKVHCTSCYSSDNTQTTTQMFYVYV